MPCPYYIIWRFAIYPYQEANPDCMHLQISYGTLKAVSLLFTATAFMLAAIIGCHHQKDIPPPDSAIITTGIPPVPDSLKQQMERYQSRQFTQPVDWAPNGSGIVVLGRIGEMSQLYMVAAPGDSLVPLTFINESVISAAVCPNTGRNMILFTHDSGGNENFRICALRSGTLDTVQLTNDSAQNDNIAWSNRGDRFAYTSNRRNARDFDIYIASIDSPSMAHCIISEGGNWQIHDWSPDDQCLLVGKYGSRTSSLLFTYNIQDNRLTLLTDTSETVSQELGSFGPYGSGVFYTSDKSTDFRCLHYLDFESRRDTILTSDIPWDVREIALSYDRKQLAFSTNEHGFSQLYLVDAATFARKTVSSLPRGVLGSLRFHPAGGRLLMSVNTCRHPDDAYTLDLSKMTLTRWTNHDMPGCVAIPPQVAFYPTFDSTSGQLRNIPCLIYKPTASLSPCPVLIMIHGGPETQVWPSFRPEVNFYTDKLGIAVIAPNVRGSGGYGKRYLELDNSLLREGAVRDIGALLDWIGNQSGFDTSRVAITGGSYGGFMSLAAMVRYGDRLCAGIDCYGIGNYVTFLENTAAYRRDLRRVEYGDERDSTMRQFLIDISPLTHADRISKPLLIIQGANDPRVPLSESRQIADAMQKNGSPVWFLTATDEGHGFRKKSNLDYQTWVTTMFLGEFLVR